MGKRTHGGIEAAKWLALPVAAALVLVIFASALDGLTAGRTVEDLERLEEAVRRGCLSCYAAEGRYPPDLEYLTDHYGLQVDEEKYAVVYDVFAPNLMPDITVLELKR